MGLSPLPSGSEFRLIRELMMKIIAALVFPSGSWLNDPK